jgi:hypothetical protein
MERRVDNTTYHITFGADILGDDDSGYQRDQGVRCNFFVFFRTNFSVTTIFLEKFRLEKQTLLFCCILLRTKPPLSF